MSEGYHVFWSVALASMGNRADAEDVLQESILIAFRKQDSFEPGTRFHAWMNTIIRNVAANARRARHRRATALQGHAASEIPATMEIPADPVRVDSGDLIQDQDAFDDRVAAALQSLPATARACVLLRVVHEMDFAGISQALGIPRNTAISHVHRARRKLRQQLAEVAGGAVQEGNNA